VYEVLDAYRIPAAGWRVAANSEEAVKAAAEIGFPIVVKADAETIVHKSDVGGVVVDVRDSNSLRSAVEGMKERLGTKGLRFLIQKYVPGGTEIIIGARAEEGLGHLVMLGMGGIYVEIMKDVVFKLTPVTTVEAHEMISSLQAAPLLRGARGREGVNLERIVEIILRVSQLVSECPMIQELDLNPVIANADQATVVDARILIAKSP
jgi:acetyltransferase